MPPGREVERVSAGRPQRQSWNAGAEGCRDTRPGIQPPREHLRLCPAWRSALVLQPSEAGCVPLSWLSDTSVCPVAAAVRLSHAARSCWLLSPQNLLTFLKTVALQTQLLPLSSEDLFPVHFILEFLQYIYSLS